MTEEARDDTTGDLIRPSELPDFIAGYFRAWNSRESSRVAACATEDVIWNSPALPSVAHGHRAVAALVASTAAAFPDYRFSQPTPWAVADDGLRVYVPWRMTGTNTGSFVPPGYAPTGRRIDLTGIDVWQFRNGLIWRYEAVYNYSILGRQLGLVPPRGGAVERLAVQGQRLLVRLFRHRLTAGGTGSAHTSIAAGDAGW